MNEWGGVDETNYCPPASKETRVSLSAIESRVSILLFLFSWDLITRRTLLELGWGGGGLLLYLIHPSILNGVWRPPYNSALPVKSHHTNLQEYPPPQKKTILTQRDQRGVPRADC